MITFESMWVRNLELTLRFSFFCFQEMKELMLRLCQTVYGDDDRKLPAIVKKVSPKKSTPKTAKSSTKKLLVKARRPVSKKKQQVPQMSIKTTKISPSKKTKSLEKKTKQSPAKKKSLEKKTKQSPAKKTKVKKAALKSPPSVEKKPRKYLSKCEASCFLIIIISHVHGF